MVNSGLKGLINLSARGPILKSDGLSARGLTLSVSVYYVAVRTIVLSRHGSNLARPVIIHDIIHDLICVPSTPCCGFLGSRRMVTAPTSIEALLRPSQSQSDEPSDLRGYLSPTSVYSHPSDYEPGATLLNFSDRAQTVERTPYSVYHTLDFRI